MRRAYELVRAALAGFGDDRSARTAAALAFYTVFSLAPLLIISIAIAGFFFGADAARGEIVGQIRGLVGEAGAQAIEEMLLHAARPGAGVIAALIGAATLLFGATTAFAELKDGLDQIWHVETERARGLLYTVRKRLLSFGLVLALGFLLLVSLVFSALIAALQRFWVIDGTAGSLLEATNFLISFALVAALCGIIYKLLPAARIAWRDVAIGSIVTALLFTIGKELIGLYLGHSATASSYGAAGSVILLLLWVYYSALIFLFGAHFTRQYALHWGSRSHGGTPVQPPGGAAAA